MQTSTTSVEEIKRRRRIPITVTLPESQAVVQLARPSVLELVAAGRIPDHLTPVVVRGVLEEISKPDVAADKAIDLHDAVNAVCVAAFREPEMALEPASDQLHPEDLPFTDRMFAYSIVMRTEGVDDIVRFHPEPGGDVAPVADVAGVPGPPVEPGGD